MPPSLPTLRKHRTGRGRSVARSAVLVTTLLLLFAVGGSSHSAPGPAGLDAPVRATWTSVPLRDWARRVSEITGATVIVDRRLDPDVSVTLASDGDTLRALLDRVAASAGAAVEPLASTTRLIPRELAGRAAAAEAARDRSLRQLPAEIRRIAERQAAWHWPAAARPRDLVAAAADDAGITIAGLDRVPHDHLPATSLPPLQLAERLDLMLANFDLRIDWSPAGGTIVPIDAGVDPRDRTAVRQVPGRPRPPRQKQKPAGIEVYSLRLEAPLNQAVSAVAKSLGLEVSLDEASLVARGIAPGEIVRVDARDLSRDDLLDAIVGPLDLAWTVENGTLRVFAAPARPAVHSTDPP